MYVVVLLTGSPCEANGNTHCVMEVKGPWTDREVAERIASLSPAWTTPHVMTLGEPGSRMYKPVNEGDDNW